MRGAHLPPVASGRPDRSPRYVCRRPRRLRRRRRPRPCLRRLSRQRQRRRRRRGAGGELFAGADDDRDRDSPIYFFRCVRRLPPHAPRHERGLGEYTTRTRIYTDTGRREGGTESASADPPTGPVAVGDEVKRRDTTRKTRKLK